MTAIARVGDIGVGICYDHDSPTSYTTTFISGSTTVMANGAVSCIVGTIGVSSCGHNTVALSGSPDVSHSNQPVHRVGDTGSNSGPYTVVSGSPNVNAN